PRRSHGHPACLRGVGGGRGAEPQGSPLRLGPGRRAGEPQLRQEQEGRPLGLRRPAAEDRRGDPGSERSRTPDGRRAGREHGHLQPAEGGSVRHYTFPLLGREFPVTVPERPDELREFLAWVSRQTAPGAVDTETHGLEILSGDPEYVRLIQFGNENEAWNIPTELGEPFKEAARTALRILIDGVGITGHNFHGFDAPALHAHLGLSYDELCRNAVDTMLLSKLVDP